ncbi:E3 ubiquitin-protein ligase ORTHRUS 1 like [Verticillium longisporum]|nr:E3 ubiquitin-protein ligase ORTHRUS 1 like [Verticillium longisporum]
MASAAAPAATGDSIELPIVDNDQNFIIRECSNAIAKLIVLSKRQQAPTDEVRRVILFFNWLETRTWGPYHVTADIKKKLINSLAAINNNSRPEGLLYFTPEIRTRAEALHTRWTATNVEDGIVAAGSDNGGDDGGSGTEVIVASSTRNRTSATSNTETLRLPHRAHPIFGRNGIMHGLFITGSKRKTYGINPIYKNEQRDSSPIGDNGLTAGDWWPLQSAAVFNGAHGSWSGGIAGKKEGGAVSIVTSGHYEDLDRDDGDTLFYSGSGSHDNTDPNVVKDTSGTQLMRTAQNKGNHIRVLRSSSGGGGSWCPSIGIRYDGLYRIVGRRTLKNRLGGVYEQFELHRLPGQQPLNTIRRQIPTGQQKRLYEEMKNGY